MDHPSRNPDGRLDQIWVAPAAGGAMVAVDSAVLEAGRGIVGDRYHAGAGTFSRWPGEGRAVSLIEAGAVEAILAETGLDLRAGQHRRNLVTRGVRLVDLIGRTFQIGPALLRGTRVCYECRRPDNLLGHAEPLIKTALHGRPGLRADVVKGGVVSVGDLITYRT